MRWVAMLALSSITGCSALNPLPEQSVLRTFRNADRLVANGHEITDAETIDGLRNIYRSAKWRPFIDTEPADQVSIEVYSGTARVLHFRYGAGWLMEESRKCILTEDQQKWMTEKIRSKIPKENLPNVI